MIAPTEDEFSDAVRQVVSFEEVEDAIARVAWCKPLKKEDSRTSARGLTPVAEEQEFQTSMPSLNVDGKNEDESTMAIPLTSTNPPITVHLSFSKLAEPLRNCTARFQETYTRL